MKKNIAMFFLFGVFILSALAADRTNGLGVISSPSIWSSSQSRSTDWLVKTWGRMDFFTFQIDPVKETYIDVFTWNFLGEKKKHFRAGWIIQNEYPRRPVLARDVLMTGGFFSWLF